MSARFPSWFTSSAKCIVALHGTLGCVCSVLDLLLGVSLQADILETEVDLDVLTLKMQKRKNSLTC